MVLEPLSKQELESIFDTTAQEVIRYFLDKMIYMQPELHYDQKESPIQIPKEHIEQWIVQALDVDSVGAGSNCLDVLKKGEFGADVKMLSCTIDNNGNLDKIKLSGETSLAQKFKGVGADLDTLFKNEEYDIIVNEWKDILKNKYNDILKDIKNIYYFILLRAGKTFYLCGIKLKLDELNNVKANITQSNTNNVVVDNMLDNEYGNIRVYKAKKRMELRLKAYKWVEEDKVIKFKFTTMTPRVNLREMVKNKKLDKHKRQIYRKVIQNGKFKFFNWK